VCEGVSGPGLGLCKAAIKVGCFGDETDPPGCENIAATYTTLTGETPPWLPSSCPCWTEEELLNDIGRPFDNVFFESCYWEDAGDLVWEAYDANTKGLDDIVTASDGLTGGDYRCSYQDVGTSVQRDQGISSGQYSTCLTSLMNGCTSRLGPDWLGDTEDDPVRPK
jgi:hypothetical protein